MSREPDIRPSRRRSVALAVAVAVGLVAIVCVLQFPTSVPRLQDAQLRNPDSYYKLVLLNDRVPGGSFSFVARDNAPDGNQLHWSMLHSATLWQLHRLLRVAGLEREPALRYAGAAVTFASMLAVALFVALALVRIGTPRAVAVSGLVLASSAALRGYGYIIQITHHIFMLVPLAAAAACLLQPPQQRRPWLDLCGGLSLGLALWISPETLPMVVGLAGVRSALRLQHPQSGALWPIAVGLLLMIMLGWTVDPPPAGFSRWALDHISLAYVVLAVLLAGLLLAADACVRQGWSLPRALAWMTVAALAGAALWLRVVPGVRDGPAGLIPEELRRLFWDHILELKPARGPEKFARYVLVPLCAGLIAALAAWKRRSLWLAALAMMSLGYAALAYWHIRMGAAAAVAAALAWSAAVATLRGMNADDDATLTRRELAIALCVGLAPCLLMLTHTTLARLYPPLPWEMDLDLCNLQPVAAQLNRLPPATMLTALTRGPELLYRTHHRIVAGPYHHNVQGMLDNFRAWMDAGDGRAEEIVRRRGVDYVLGCVAFQHALRGQGAARTLAQRVADGDVPSWLEPMPWSAGTETGWRLYRVHLADVPAPDGAAAREQGS
ncbi:hypothetical protein AAG565_05070 [Fontimonas sp. SYSU GA230001]|uniref:hypothetical protein n=1 Tax=Fontimonas sp. SYSU GA230001 TaxID=3142450 RepID=UPI0032B4F8A6